MGVLHGAVEPQAAGRRVAVGGVTEQKHRSGSETIGDDALELPVADGVNLHLVVVGQTKHRAELTEQFRLVALAYSVGEGHAE